MAEELKNIELIEQYFENTLSEKDKVEFESRMLVDDELREEIELFKNIVAGIKDAGEEKLKHKLKIVDLELDANENSLIKASPKNKGLFYWKIAASITLIIGLSIFILLFKSTSTVELADKYYEKENGLPVQMANTKSTFDDAMNEYKTGNYDKSIAMLVSIKSSSPANDTACYFIGVIKYEQNKFTDATENFKLVNSTSQYFEKAQYRLSLSLLQLNQKGEAINVLNEIAKKPNNIYYDQSKSLLKELDQ